MKQMGKGLSVLELLACTACVVIAAGILFPVFAESKINCGGSSTRSLSNAKQCAIGMLMYSSDYDDLVPYVRTEKKLIAVLHPYTKNDDIWNTWNPTNPAKFHLNPSLPGVSLFNLDEPGTIPMLFDVFGQKKRGENAQRFSLAYADGHGRTLTEKAWLAAQPYLYLELKRHGKPLEP